MTAHGSGAPAALLGAGDNKLPRRRGICEPLNHIYALKSAQGAALSDPGRPLRLRPRIAVTRSGRGSQPQSGRAGFTCPRRIAYADGSIPPPGAALIRAAL